MGPKCVLSLRVSGSPLSSTPIVLNGTSQLPLPSPDTACIWDKGAELGGGRGRWRRMGRLHLPNFWCS